MNLRQGSPHRCNASRQPDLSWAWPIYVVASTNGPSPISPPRWAGNRALTRFDETIRDCDQALERDPSLAAAYLVRGSARAQQELYPEACADFARALELEPH